MHADSTILVSSAYPLATQSMNRAAGRPVAWGASGSWLEAMQQPIAKVGAGDGGEEFKEGESQSVRYEANAEVTPRPLHGATVQWKAGASIGGTMLSDLGDDPPPPLRYAVRGSSLSAAIVVAAHHGIGGWKDYITDWKEGFDERGTPIPSPKLFPPVWSQNLRWDMLAGAYHYVSWDNNNLNEQLCKVVKEERGILLPRNDMQVGVTQAQQIMRGAVSKLTDIVEAGRDAWYHDSFGTLSGEDCVMSVAAAFANQGVTLHHRGGPSRYQHSIKNAAIAVAKWDGQESWKVYCCLSGLNGIAAPPWLQSALGADTTWVNESNLVASVFQHVYDQAGPIYDANRPRGAPGWPRYAGTCAEDKLLTRILQVSSSHCQRSEQTI